MLYFYLYFLFINKNNRKRSFFLLKIQNLLSHLYLKIKMINITRTNSQNKDFLELVKKLDAYLSVTDGNEHDFYDQYNKLNHIKHVVLAYKNDVVVSCGAIKAYNDNSIEVKRMFTLPDFRGQGFATYVLNELENWAKELSYTKTILETGKRQLEAVKFYQKNAYITIPNYGQYVDVENSICFEKELI